MDIRKFIYEKSSPEDLNENYSRGTENQSEIVYPDKRAALNEDILFLTLSHERFLSDHYLIDLPPPVLHF